MPRQIPPIQNSFLCAKILVIANEVEQTSIAYFANAITNRFQIEPSGYSHGMATFYFLTNLVSLCARAAVVGREGGWSACSQASGLMALTFSLFFIFRISALKKQESNDSIHHRNSVSGFLWWEPPSRASGAPLARPIFGTSK